MNVLLIEDDKRIAGLVERGLSAWTDRSSGAVTLSPVLGGSAIDLLPAAQNNLPGVQSSLVAGAANTGTGFLVGPTATSAAAQYGYDFDYNTPFSLSVALKLGAFASGTTGFQQLIGNGANESGIGCFFDTNRTAATPQIVCGLSTGSTSMMTALSVQGTACYTPGIDKREARTATVPAIFDVSSG